MQTSEFRFLPNTSSHRVPSQTLLHLLKWMMKTQIPQALIFSHLLIIQELLLFLSLCLVLRIIQVVLGLCFSHWVKETSLDLWMVKSLCQILPLLCSMQGIDPIQQFFLGWPIRWARKLQLVWYIYISTQPGIFGLTWEIGLHKGMFLDRLSFQKKLLTKPTLCKFLLTKFKILWNEFVNYQPFPSCTCGCTCGSQQLSLMLNKKIMFSIFL